MYCFDGIKMGQMSWAIIKDSVECVSNSLILVQFDSLIFYANSWNRFRIAEK